MRVLHVIPQLPVGGAERMLLSLVRHQLGAGYEIGVVSLYDPLGSLIEAELRELPVQVSFLGKRPGLDLRMIPRLARELRRFRPELLHTHMQVLRYALPARWLGGRCPVVHTMHTTAFRDASDWPTRLLQRVAFRTGVVPVAIGDAVAESIHQVYGVMPRHVIPNGIPVATYAGAGREREQVRAELGIPAGAPVLVCVAQLHSVKNHQGLLGAFASERLAAAGAHLLLVGDGVLRGALEAQARQLGVADRVHFLGTRPDVPRILAAADVFVLASTVEGNPLSVMEAMAAGKPVVATAVGCIPELVTGPCGRLVPAGDPGALEDAMVALVRDASLARAAGEAAARAAAARFDDSHMAVAYEKLYAEVL
jgi:glycosyltransferase involved in cell wall biosynthesis